MGQWQYVGKDNGFSTVPLYSILRESHKWFAAHISTCLMLVLGPCCYLCTVIVSNNSTVHKLFTCVHPMPGMRLDKLQVLFFKYIFGMTLQGIETSLQLWQHVLKPTVPIWWSCSHDTKQLRKTDPTNALHAVTG